MSTLEENIQLLNDYLAQENTVLQDNIKNKRKINALEGEIDRSKNNFQRYLLIVFYLSIICFSLLIYNMNIDIMYPFRLLSDFLSGSGSRQLLLISAFVVIIVSVLYFSRSSYSKLVTSLTVTGIIYWLLSSVFGLSMNYLMFVIFLFVFFFFDL